MAAAIRLIALSIVASMSFVMMTSVSAVDHVVGGTIGWRNPPNVSFYQDWARSRTFVVGDKLVFLFMTGVHNVLEVSKSDFDACTQDSVIEMHYNGPTTLPVKLGSHYYYCGVGTHCEAGQKLSITLADSAGSGGTAALAPDVTKESPPAKAPTSPNSDDINDKSSSNLIHCSGIVAGLSTLLLSLFM